MKKSKFDSSICVVDDNVRKVRMMTLLKKSIDQDIKSWTLTYVNSDLLRYQSPNYNGESFVVEFYTTSYGGLSKGAIYTTTNKPLIPSCNKMCVDEWESNNYLETDISNCIKTLRSSVFTDDIKTLDGFIGTDLTAQRKNKLLHLELDELRGKVEESYQNWQDSPYSKSLAQQIALTAFAFNKSRSFPYSEWYERFKDCHEVIAEIKKFDNNVQGEPETDI